MPYQLLRVNLFADLFTIFFANFRKNQFLEKPTFNASLCKCDLEILLPRSAVISAKVLSLNVFSECFGSVFKLPLAVHLHYHIA